jgi:O-antigen/teichoic acid export membrane protein
MPMMVGLAVLAKPFVLVVFGEKWLPCVPYLQLLSFVGVFWPLHVINLNLLRAMGRSDLFFRLEVMKTIVTGVALLITCTISVMAIAWGVLLSSIAGLMLNTLYSKGLIRYGLLSQLRDLAPYGGVSASMGVLGWFVGNAFSSQPAAQLALAVLSGAAFYCTICYALRLEAFRFVLELVFSQLPWGRRSAIQSC